MASQLREAWRTKYLGFPNFEASGISKAILEKEKTLYFHIPIGLEATVGVGNPLDMSQPQDSHVYAFPPLRYNPTHFVVTQIVNEYWFCSLLILGDGGWVGINFFVGALLLDSWPSFTSAHALRLSSNWCLSFCARVMGGSRILKPQGFLRP